MTGMDILSLVIGLVWGCLATWGFATILLRGTRARQMMRWEPPASDLDFYPGQIIIIERPMLKDGEQ